MGSSETDLRRWDNPVPMTCDATERNSSAMADYCGQRHSHCGDDAMYVLVRGEDVVHFRCWRHRLEPATR